MKQFYRAIVLVSASILLAACSSHDLSSSSQSVSHLNSDHGTYSKVLPDSAVRREVVTKYVPVPIPGQLMPMPNVAETPDLGSKKHVQKGFLTKQAAVAYANQHATQQPSSHDFFNAMMRYGYMHGAMYTVYCAPMKITDLAFQPGERIVSTAAGDTLRWQLSQTYSGEGANMVQHILVKPNSGDLQNTLVVTTNRRVYHILLDSTKDCTYMVSVKWYYPKSMVSYSGYNGPNGPANAPDATASVSTGTAGSPYALDLEKLDFNYKFGMLKGSKPAWYPVRVFNNGRQTFIEFPKRFYAQNTPVLFVQNDNDKYGTMVNSRMKGRYLIVDSLFKRARLQTGVKSQGGQTIVQIVIT